MKNINSPITFVVKKRYYNHDRDATAVLIPTQASKPTVFLSALTGQEISEPGVMAG
ncbi:MAG: hypothetical protein M9959_14070 [Chitinophagaceae bacterium]|nr:hypothetical protein [Chitinophagaceae bacterium]